MLVTPTAFAALQTVIDARALAAVPVYVVEQSAMDDIVGFNIHRGCLALAERPAVAALTTHPLSNVSRVLALEGVNNPDNVGGIFRSAAAFGVELVVLGPACGDPLYRKAIRTSMAATLDVPYVTSGPWPDALDTLRGAGLSLLALTPGRSAVSLEDVKATGRTTLMLGSEGAGLTSDALARADAHVRIAMTDSVDSLNVTVAASIAMYRLFGTR